MNEFVFTLFFKHSVIKILLYITDDKAIKAAIVSKERKKVLLKGPPPLVKISDKGKLNPQKVVPRLVLGKNDEDSISSRIVPPNKKSSPKETFIKLCKCFPFNIILFLKYCDEMAVNNHKRIFFILLIINLYICCFFLLIPSRLLGATVQLLFVPIFMEINFNNWFCHFF